MRNDATDPSPEKPGQIQSVSRAIRLLTLVALGQVPARGAALARAAGLPAPTAHHLLRTLTAERMLAKSADGTYTLGPRVAVLAECYQRDVLPPSYLLDPLRKLVTTTGETGYIASWRHADIRMLAVIDGELPVRAAVPAAPYTDGHARASGKLLLALTNEERRAAYLAQNPLRALTPRTITSATLLEEEFGRIRQRGYSIDREEFQQGVSCIAAPVIQDETVVASMSLSVPAARLVRRQDELLDALLTIAKSVGIGGSGAAKLVSSAG